MKTNKAKQYFIISGLSLTLLAAVSCTSTKNTGKSPADDPVTANSNPSTTPSEELPAELLDAQKFDPATTLDPKVVQESDFYQVKQTVEQNKAALDAGWKEQDRIESAVKSTAAQEEAKKAALLKAEEEERERQRVKQVEAFEKSKDQRAKDEKKAQDAANKLPGISNDEVNWKGLED